MIILPCPISVEEWPALAMQHRLHAQRALVGLDGELTLVIESLTGEDIWCSDRKDKTMQEAMSSLKKILQEMLVTAAKMPGKAVRHDLPGGLRIDVLINHLDNTTHMQLSRNYTWPSATEFATVLNHLPYDLPLDLEPLRQVHDDRYYLRCKWETIALEAPSPTPPDHQQAARSAGLAGKQ